MRTATGWIIGGFAVVCLGGCANPLFSDSSDYGRVLAVERLRSVEALDMGAYASTEPEPDRRPTPEEIRERLAGKESVELSLPACRAAALAGNLDLRVALIDPTIANATLSAEEAAFEAFLFVNARWVNTDSPTASTLTSAQQDFRSLEPGVTIPLRTGGTATISAPFTRNKTNNSFATLNPSYTADLQVSLSQPLLRSAGRFSATQAIRVASYNRQISEAQTTLAIIAQISAVDQAYWRVYQARKELDVRQQQYELAMDQLGRAERLVKAGRVAEVEVIRAEAGVAQRLEAIIVAHSAVLTRQRELKRRIALPGLEVGTTTMVIPTTQPDPIRYDLDAAVLADAAVVQRMEMLELELRLLADAANIRVRERDLLPLLNADFTYRLNGLSDDVSGALDQAVDNDFEDWSVGLRAEIPLGNDAAEARLRGAVFNRLRRLATRAARDQTIRQEVHDAVDRMGSDWQRVLAARQSVVLNARALTAEENQFAQQRSTSTDVLIAASQLADAQLAEISAIVDYQLDQVELARATGSLLGASRVRWEPTQITRGSDPITGE